MAEQWQFPLFFEHGLLIKHNAWRCFSYEKNIIIALFVEFFVDQRSSSYLCPAVVEEVLLVLSVKVPIQDCKSTQE